MISLFFLLALAIAGTLASSPLTAAEVAVEDSIRKYRFLAKTARQKKEYDDAVRYYRSYLTYKADDHKAFFFLGDILYRQNQYDQARAAFLQVVALDSLHYNSNLRLYQLYAHAGQADSAAHFLAKVVRAKPEKNDLRRKLGDLYRRDNQTTDAIRHYTHLVKAGHQKRELSELLAVLYEDQGDIDQALHWRQRLLQNSGGNKRGPPANQVKSLEDIVKLQIKTGDTKGAYQNLTSLAALDSSNSYSYYSQIVQLAEKNGDKTTWVQGLENMAQAQSQDLETVAQLAKWHLKNTDDATARTWINRGLKVNPADGQLLIMQGGLLANAGDEEGAIASFEKAKADPNWEDVAQQRIWQLRPPETVEEKLKREFFGGEETQSGE
ncbi:MAG: tetratricopeptide repeat protein [Candidatus Latescibacteria bacterium]|nr:tetratricopeptide repeat protein [Candidatus Latescibacterota bacterium]